MYLVPTAWHLKHCVPRILQDITALSPMVTISDVTGLYTVPPLEANGAVCGGKPTSSGIKDYLCLEMKVVFFFFNAIGSLTLPLQGINHGISQDGYVAILTAYRTPPPQPFFLRYLSIPFYRVYSSSITALLVDLIHVFFLAFAPT
jgi:hypothetical protein